MFSISDRWVPGGRGAASTFTIRITDETAKMSQNACRSNRCFSGKGAINITYRGCILSRQLPVNAARPRYGVTETFPAIAGQEHLLVLPVNVTSRNEI